MGVHKITKSILYSLMKKMMPSLFSPWKEWANTFGVTPWVVNYDNDITISLI
jgi:hypothetical protein